MTLLVRSESDGYLPSKATGSKATPASSSNPPPTLSELIAATKIGTAAIPASKDTDAAIKITPSNAQIPQTAIFDLKTRSAYGDSKIDMDTILPRLWANQTPNFIIAYHRSGWFKAAETRIKDVRKDVDRWEKGHGKALAVMGGLLKALVKAAGGASDGRIAVGTGRDGQLEVYEPADLLWTVLPPDLIAAWTKGAEEDGDEGDGDRDGDGDSEDDEVDGGHAPDLDDEAEEYARLFDHAADGDDGRGDESSGQDFTACSAEDCGYCGHCRH